MRRKKKKPAVWGWNIHPGEILREEFLKPLGITVYELAKRVHLTRSRVNDIVRGHRAVTADTALRLAKFFGTTPAFWMNLQTTYELREAANSSAREIEAIEHIPMPMGTRHPLESVHSQ
ncbi:MAG TPA: HigA family addiction module antitoxin [Candidatus Angelobacter sp.]|nr:HigA family addiction module antitoxin [Candidatus Angelobacter sp.]